MIDAPLHCGTCSGLKAVIGGFICLFMDEPISFEEAYRRTPYECYDAKEPED
jgi:hypothetical protein